LLFVKIHILTTGELKMLGQLPSGTFLKWVREAKELLIMVTHSDSFNRVGLTEDEKLVLQSAIAILRRISITWR
jgi:hypothetical protein